MHLIEAYERMGGEAVIRRLVDRFYDLMDEDPDYYGIRKLHPQDLTSSREKLFMFLSGWTGGPTLYTDKYGDPRLRSRTWSSDIPQRSNTYRSDGDWKAGQSRSSAGNRDTWCNTASSARTTRASSGGNGRRDSFGSTTGSSAYFRGK